jgi:hypothetical protein
MFTFDNENSPSESFTRMGYSSDSIIDNIGSMLVYLFGYFPFVGVTILIGLAKNKFKL